MKHMDRRKFLRLSGTCALAALAGSACTLISENEDTAGLQTCPYAMSYDPYPGQCSNYIDSNGSGYCDLSEDGSMAEAVRHDEPTAAPTKEPAVVQPTQQPTQAAQPQSKLVVLCQRGCSYPGHCRRFRDNDSTGICDLSEGINPNEL